jgi:hypothetical protein
VPDTDLGYVLLFLLNNPYFQRKSKESTMFPLVMQVFLLYLQRISTKADRAMIVGREILFT